MAIHEMNVLTGDIKTGINSDNLKSQTKDIEITAKDISAKVNYTKIVDLGDTSVHDDSKWYYFMCDGVPDTSPHFYEVRIDYRDSGNPSWGNNYNYSLGLIWADGGATVLYDNNNTTTIPVSISLLYQNGAHLTFILRGGAKYKIITDFIIELTETGPASPPLRPHQFIPIGMKCSLIGKEARIGDTHDGPIYIDNYGMSINNITSLKEDGFRRVDDDTHQSSLLMKGYNDCREMSISERFEGYSSTVGLICGTINGGIPYFGVWGTGTNLGNPGRQWKQVYADTATISTSDRNKKKDISYMGEESGIDTQLSDDTLIQFIMSLKPCVYRFKQNDSNRPHHGMISQDIEEIIESGLIPDHGGFIKSPKVILVEDKDEEGNIILDENGNPHYHDEIVEGEYDYSLRNEEFISDVIRFSQILKEENDALKQRVQTLEDTISKVLEKLDTITGTN